MTAGKHLQDVKEISQKATSPLLTAVYMSVPAVKLVSGGGVLQTLCLDEAASSSKPDRKFVFFFNSLPCRVIATD